MPFAAPIRTVLALEHRASRHELAEWLECESDLRIVGAADTGRATVEMVEQTSPDLLLMKIELPELDGFAVLDTLGSRVPPAVVLVSTRSQHAVRAFGKQALDYLLQPIDRERLQLTLDRVRRRLARLDLDTLPPDEGADAPPERVAVPSGGRLRLLRTDDITWIQARGRHCNIHLGGTVVKAELTLGALERRLPTAQFMRVNRSVMVRLARIREARPKSHGDHWVLLDTGERLVLSRNRRSCALRRLASAS
jgi:two-component system LytT family response regulator